MSRVLLLDPDGDHAKQIEWVLRGISCQTTACTDVQGALSLLQRRQFDVVLVVSVPGVDWDLRVDFIRRAVIRLPDSPQIVCLLRGPYRNPAERVYAARKGFKVVYEQ